MATNVSIEIHEEYAVDVIAALSCSSARVGARKTYQSEGEMDRGRPHDNRLGRRPAVDQGGDVAGGGHGLLGGGPRRLVRARVGHVADGKQVWVRRVRELHRGPDPDEAVAGVDQLGPRGRRRRRQGGEELGVGRLARGLDHEVGRERPAVVEGDLDARCIRVSAEGVATGGDLDTSAADEAVCRSAT